MFVRNLLKAGDYATVVPIGLKCTLQYNENGILEKVFYGFGESRIENPKMFSTVLKSDVPTKISLRGGTSWVIGCFYNHNWKYIPNNPKLKEELVEDYLLRPEEYRFYAGLVESYASQFRGSIPIRQWLTVSGFDLLPGYVISSEMNEKKFESMLKSSDYPFEFPLITDYIIFRNGMPSYADTKICQYEVNSLEQFTTTDGYTKSHITMSELNEKVQFISDFSYSSVVRYNIRKDSVITLNSDGDIIFSDNRSVKTSDMYSREMECPFCGKIIKIPLSGKVQCSDTHCNSRLFKRVNHFLNTFGLKSIDYDTYLSMIGTYKLGFNISDVLEYEDVDVIDCKLTDAVRAIIPLDVIPKKKQINDFVKACNNSVSTIKYYANNVETMVDDLGLDNHLYSRLVSWFRNVRNILDLETTLDSSKLNIYSDIMMFDGQPILRGKNIYITGKFKHGSNEEISKIFEGYSATVSPNYKESKIDMIVVGDTNEGVLGSSILYARENRIPVFYESDVFSMYGIDNDLNNFNL